MKISKYLHENLIFFLDANSRDDALQKLTDLVFREGKLEDKQFFYDAILEREKIVSTGIGMGVAIPHAKLAGFEGFFIALAVLSKGVEWNALDEAPVRLIFMIGGPDDKQTEYLQILSTLTTVIKNEERRKKILTSHSPVEIAKLFHSF